MHCPLLLLLLVTCSPWWNINFINNIEQLCSTGSPWGKRWTLWKFTASEAALSTWDRRSRCRYPGHPPVGQTHLRGGNTPQSWQPTAAEHHGSFFWHSGCNSELPIWWTWRQCHLSEPGEWMHAVPSSHSISQPHLQRRHFADEEGSQRHEGRSAWCDDCAGPFGDGGVVLLLSSPGSRVIQPHGKRDSWDGPWGETMRDRDVAWVLWSGTDLSDFPSGCGKGAYFMLFSCLLLSIWAAPTTDSIFFRSF